MSRIIAALLLVSAGLFVLPVNAGETAGGGVTETEVIVDSIAPPAPVAVEREIVDGPPRTISEVPELEETDPLGPAAPSDARVVRKGSVITGAALFGASEGIALFITAIISSLTYSGDNPASTLWIPVAGPLILGFGNGGTTGEGTMLCVGWAAAEGIGLSLLISGLVGRPVQHETSFGKIELQPVVSFDKVGLKLKIGG